MKYTIYDIAAKAGVSKSTVSRVMNNQENISHQSKQKVLQAIEELNYIPSQVARGLTGNAFDAILALTHRQMNSLSGNPFFTDVIHSISSISEENNYDLILQTSKNFEDELHKIKNKINQKLIKGILILSSSIDEGYLYELDKLSIPIVVIGKTENHYHNIYSVDTDNFSDSYQMVDYLIKNGHTKISCIHASLDYHVSVDRLNGFKKAMTDNKLEIHNEYIHDGDVLLDDSVKGIANMINSKEPPTAIFTTDALKAFSIYQVMEKHQLSIPEDLSIISFNDSTYINLFSPKLTGSVIPTYELGKIATQILFKVINGEKNIDKNTIVPTKFISGGSIKKIEN